MVTEQDIMDTGMLGFIEVVNGAIVTLSPNSYRQNLIAKNIYNTLYPYTAHGFISCGHIGYVLKREGKHIVTMRQPDVSYMRREPDFSGDSFLPEVPDLAVKVAAVYETADTLEQHIRDYLAAGTQQVWLVYPEAEEVYTYTAHGITQRYTRDDMLIVRHLFPLRVMLAVRAFFKYAWNRA